VHELSDWLDKAVQEDAFDQLVLVAPPQTLGELRKVLKPSVHARILAELNKDLTKMNKLALQEELTKTVWF
jgi:protein required for attachment to host cells